MDANLSPCPVSGRIKVSDELFTYHVSLDARVGGLVAREHVRQGVRVWVAERTRGLEAPVLRITHDAPVASLLRYGLVIAGSRWPGALANKIDAMMINAAARRIAGLP